MIQRYKKDFELEGTFKITKYKKPSVCLTKGRQLTFADVCGTLNPPEKLL
jgi:hypothetical protein